MSKKQELIKELKGRCITDAAAENVADDILARERKQIEKAIKLLAEAKTMLIISGYATSKVDRARDYIKWSNKVNALYNEIMKG